MVSPLILNLGAGQWAHPTLSRVFSKDFLSTHSGPAVPGCGIGTDQAWKVPRDCVL